MANYGNPEHNPWNPYPPVSSPSISPHVPGSFDSDMAPPLGERTENTKPYRSIPSSDSPTASLYEINQSREWEDMTFGSIDVPMADAHANLTTPGQNFSHMTVNEGSKSSNSNMGYFPSPSPIASSGISFQIPNIRIPQTREITPGIFSNGSSGNSAKIGRIAEDDNTGKAGKRQQLSTPVRYRLDQANAQIEYQTALIRDKVAKNKVQAAKIQLLEEQLANHEAAEKHYRRMGKQKAVSIEIEDIEDDDSAELDAQEALEVEKVLRESREAFQKIGSTSKHITETDRRLEEQQAEILALRKKLQRNTLATSSTLTSQLSPIPPTALSSDSTSRQLPTAPPVIPNPSNIKQQHSQDSSGHAIHSIEAPQYTSFFITPGQRRARNAAQDNLVCPRRTVGIPRLPFVAPGSHSSTNNPAKIKRATDLFMEIEEQTSDLDLNRPQDIRILVDMLHQVLESLGDDGQRIRSRTNTRLKEGSLKYLEQKKKEEQDRIGPVDDKRWKQSIREIFKQFYDVAFANDFMSYQSADQFLVAQYEKGIGEGPDASLPLSLSPGDINSRWNRRVITHFIEALSSLRDATPHRWYLPNVSDLYLRALFLNQVREAQKAWSTAQPKTRYFEDGTLREETMEEVKERIHVARPKRLQTVSARSFRARKFLRRLETAKEYAKQHGDVGLVWKKLVEILELLGVDGQSDEEEAVRYTPSGKRVYVIEILLCSWRAADITRYMILIDEVYEKGKASSSNKRGSKGQTRERVRRESGRNATPKLPRAFYDSQWLEAQDECYIEDVLRISSADFRLLEPLLQTEFSS